MCDESQYLKSRTAQRTKAVLPLLERARRALLLSGTPALSSPSELYTQLHALAPSTFGTFSSYANRYCAARRTRFGLDVRGSSNLPELHTALFASVALRRLKADVLQQLPSKRREVLVLPCSAAKGEVQRLQRLLEAPGGQGREAARGRRKLLLTSFQEAGLTKVPALIRHVRRVADDARAPKTVLFGHHLAVLDAVESGALSQIGHVRIDGSTPLAARQQAVRAFQEDPAVRFALIAISAGGTALTLTAAQSVVFLELYWTPGSLLQATRPQHSLDLPTARRPSSAQAPLGVHIAPLPPLSLPLL